MSTQHRAPQRRKWPWVLAFVILTLVVWISVTSNSSDDQTVTSPATADAPWLATTAPEAAPTPQQGTVPPAYDVQLYTSGTYPVGTEAGDIAPGSYSTAGPDRESGIPCYWSRLKDDNGEAMSIITNGLVQGPGRMAVKSSDKFIEFTGACQWGKVTAKR